MPPTAPLNGADLAWMMTSTALVLLMTPALGFFYGGMVGTKNVLNTILMSFATLAYCLVAWALLGYTLSFSPGNAIIGDVLAVDVSGSYVRSASRRVAIAGVEDLVVVETPEVVLIVGKDRSQLVRDLAALADQDGQAG